jgi:hypothetical protein
MANKLLFLILISLISLTPIFAEVQLGTPTEMQARIKGTCPINTGFTSVNRDGSVTCTAINGSSLNITGAETDPIFSANRSSIWYSILHSSDDKLNTTSSTANPNINGNLTVNNMIVNGDGSVNANSSFAFMEGGLNRFILWYDGVNNIFRYYNALMHRPVMEVQVANNNMIIYSNTTIQGGNLDVDLNITSNSLLVCLEDGTNCPGINTSLINESMLSNRHTHTYSNITGNQNMSNTRNITNVNSIWTNNLKSNNGQILVKSNINATGKNITARVFKFSTTRCIFINTSNNVMIFNNNVSGLVCP